MAPKKHRRQKKTESVYIFRRTVAVLVLLIIIVGTVFAVKSCSNRKVDKTPDNNNEILNSEPSFSKEEEGSESKIVSSAYIGSTGDIIIHDAVLSSVKQSDGSYDFSSIFPEITPYFSKYDFVVANLEVTLAGTEGGKYQGYPSFNSPDSLIDAVKKSGIDMLLTANNHSYDTRLAGMLRTVRTLKQKGMPYIGTRETQDEKFYTVRDINGIKIGMTCFTYETKSTESGRKSLNGNILAVEAGPLINSFKYDDISAFSASAKDIIDKMKSEGAEKIIFYMHWGEEYQRTQNSNQKKFAQKLCDLGVDVIIGGHPHVVQPFETLTGSSGNTSVCIYSLGNAVSNQRKEVMDSEPSGHTEDGMIFGVKFDKYSDGTIVLADVDILPIWVDLKKSGNSRAYRMIPLDINADWSNFSLTSLDSAKASYNRTMKIVGSGLNAYRESQNLPAVKTQID